MLFKQYFYQQLLNKLFPFLNVRFSSMIQEFVLYLETYLETLPGLNLTRNSLKINALNVT